MHKINLKLAEIEKLIWDKENRNKKNKNQRVHDDNYCNNITDIGNRNL